MISISDITPSLVKEHIFNIINFIFQSQLSVLLFILVVVFLGWIIMGWALDWDNKAWEIYTTVILVIFFLTFLISVDKGIIPLDFSLKSIFGNI